MDPRRAAIVVIIIGRKRLSEASKIACSGRSPRVRSASKAKSIMMIAFFLTIPMRRMIAITAISDRSFPVIISAIKAPIPAEGRVDRIVIG